ncbi:Protein of unknown function (DUF1336) [Abeliophyllum distichum]|uniref:Protein ENHANCED DISEASE RESISTANCE 2 C-terminal domain-containing protein n=1 Tax=Abeliophyllum distichum TaxID=126358 RepID=A0ABD1T1G1_9LAMI
MIQIYEIAEEKLEESRPSVFDRIQNVDISSSAINIAILRLALECITMVTVDMDFLVKAQAEEKLPKRLFGAVRICQMEMDSATFVDNAMPSKKVFLCEDESENEDE